MLNELDKSFLKRFVEEEGMMDAVKKALMIGFADLLPMPRLNESDAILGQRARALDTARSLLDVVFTNMVQYKGRDKITNKDNLER